MIKNLFGWWQKQVFGLPVMHPSDPNNLIRSFKMSHLVTFRLAWEPSPSQDVEDYYIIVNHQGVEVLNTDTDNETFEYEFTLEVQEGDALQAFVSAVDGAGNESEPIEVRFRVPDVTAPLPPASASIQIVAVEQVDVSAE